jgi:catechol 2,3-dioxygenase-like lactoylglutathione lyase family enzyme
MSKEILGIHHVTAIASDPQQNVDFYVGVLGLRLVKKTVNYDDPGTYHFYYGDALGSPGTILTFFPWPGAYRGQGGTGQATVTSLSVPEGSLNYWRERLRSHGAAAGEPATRLGEPVLPFSDPDGMTLELVAHAGTGTADLWNQGPIPAEHAIRGVHSVTLSVRRQERTASLLTTVLGFRPAGQEGNRFRFESGAGGPGTRVDVLGLPDTAPGALGAGSVHHIAWRTPSDATQQDWKGAIENAGLGVSPIMDRQYFHSIYFREPSGVLFEIATDPPGFTTDETPQTLGAGLMLPSWLEGQRALIERDLPPLRVPDVGQER